MEIDDLRSGERQVDEAGERLIADRLEALEAEKVMQRALELEALSLDEPHLISTDQLERIAKEIGVDTAFVHQALGEVRLAPPERSRFARWVLPDDLSETLAVEGVSADQLVAAIDKWMTQREGLTKTRDLGDGAEWDIDRRLRARGRAKTLSGDNRISRVAGSDVAHRVHHVSDTEHVIAMQSEGRWPLFLAKALMALGGVVALMSLLGSIAAGNIIVGMIVAAIIGGTGIAGGVSAARWWARGIRGALSRSLVGLNEQIKRGGSGILSRLKRVRRKRDS